MSNLTIKDLPCNEEIDMSAVRGGACVDVKQSLDEGFKDSGFVGMIGAAAGCLDLITNGGLPVCTD